MERTKIKFTAQNLVWVPKDEALSRSVEQSCKLKVRKDMLTESSCTVTKSTFCLNKTCLRAYEFYFFVEPSARCRFEQQNTHYLGIKL
jgi:hypothetical protein